MVLRKLAAGLALGALAFVAGCRCHQSNRVACCPQPVVVGTAPVVPAAPAPCCNGAPGVQVVPGQPPLGAQVPVAQPPCNGRY